MSHHTGSLDPFELVTHGRSLRALVGSMIRDEHCADDLVQDTFLAGIRAKPGVSNPGAWIRGVAHKLCLRAIRDESRRRRHEAERGARHAEAARAAANEAEGDPAHTQTLVLSQLAEAVHRLREPFRTAVLMRYWQGMAPRHISAELGVPLNTVRSRLQIALRDLRTRMDDQHRSRAAWVLPLAALTRRAATPAVPVAVAAAIAALALGSTLYFSGALHRDLATDRSVAALPNDGPSGVVSGSVAGVSRSRRGRGEVRPAEIQADLGPKSEAIREDTMNLQRTLLVAAPLVVAADVAPQLSIGGKWGGRTHGRERLARALPGTTDAIVRGLRWLAAHQDETGAWDPIGFMRHDKKGLACSGAGQRITPVEATGLALLAMLGDANSTYCGEHQEAVSRGIAWLRTRQRRGGSFLPSTSLNSGRGHAVATYALAEATLFAGGRSKTAEFPHMKASLEAAAIHLLNLQRDDGTFAQKPGGPRDLATTYWAVFALQTAWIQGNAHLLSAPSAERWVSGRRRVVRWVKDRIVAYAKAMEKEQDVDAVEASVVSNLLYFAGVDPKKHDGMKRTLGRIVALAPSFDASGRAADPLHVLAAMSGSYQSGRRVWQRGRAPLGRLTASQCGEGNADGSWDPAGARGRAGGRVYTTALHVMALQTYYRYTRLVR